MGNTSKNGSHLEKRWHFEIWVTLGRMCHRWKNGTRFEKKSHLEKKSPFPSAQSIDLHISSLVLILRPIPTIAVKNPEENVTTLAIWLQKITTATREPTTCAWIRADTCRRGGEICSKNRKIVLHHRCAGFQDLTSLSPIMAPWCYPFCKRDRRKLSWLNCGIIFSCLLQWILRFLWRTMIIFGFFRI